MPSPSTPPVMILPTPAGGHTAYGVTVYEIGEDGECIVAFGHHDTRRFFAACNHYARRVWGWPNLADAWSATWVEAEDEITRTEGWFDGRPENPDWEWELHWKRPEGRSDVAVPITMWRV